MKSLSHISLRAATDIFGLRYTIHPYYMASGHGSDENIYQGIVWRLVDVNRDEIIWELKIDVEHERRSARGTWKGKSYF